MKENDTKVKLLLIDDEASASWSGILDTGLRTLGFELCTVDDPDESMNKIKDFNPDVVLLDLRFPTDDLHTGSDDVPVKTTGGRLLNQLRTRYPDLPVVLFSSLYADTDILLEEYELAPHACYGKHQISEENPNWPTMLSNTLTGAISLAKKERTSHTDKLGNLVLGESAAMCKVALSIVLAAEHEDPVLIHGESGTGKVDAGAAIHELSGRSRAGKFVCLRCSGRDENTFAAALFGYTEKAGSTYSGLIEEAHLGTLCINEFQLLPATVLQELLSVLDSKQVTRQGDNSPRDADIRLVLTSRHYLGDLLDDRIIPKDFTYEISPFLISLPPLRKRLDDLPSLYREYLRLANKSCNKHVTDVLRPELLNKFKSHPWRGNLREMRRAIEHAVRSTLSNILLPEEVRLLDYGIQRSTSEVNTPKASVVDDQASVVDHLFSLPVDKRWDQFRGMNSMPENIMKPVLIGIAKRLGPNDEEGTTRVKMIDFLIDKETTLNEADYARADNRVRRLLSDRKVKLTKIDYSESG